MNIETTLPAYSDGELSALTVPELLDLLARDEDRVPRNVIDACSRRGAAMVSALGELLDRGDAWVPEHSDGQWWRALHTAMILGLMSGEAAGELLVRCMRRISDEDDENLEDWLAEHWPVFFGNKPASLMAALRGISDDRNRYWYGRVTANAAQMGLAQQIGAAAVDELLVRLAAAAADETEDWDFRLLTAITLLDFPRPQHRKLLENLAKRQKHPGAIFGLEEIEKAYGTPGYLVAQDRIRRDPWDFYQPAAIAERQSRWDREDREARERAARGEPPEEDVGDYDLLEPYIRDTPKIGRNDLCPCGSGKKYKKCCLSES